MCHSRIYQVADQPWNYRIKLNSLVSILATKHTSKQAYRSRLLGYSLSKASVHKCMHGWEFIWHFGASHVRAAEHVQLNCQKKRSSRTGQDRTTSQDRLEQCRCFLHYIFHTRDWPYHKHIYSRSEQKETTQVCYALPRMLTKEPSCKLFIAWEHHKIPTYNPCWLNCHYYQNACCTTSKVIRKYVNSIYEQRRLL